MSNDNAGQIGLVTWELRDENGNLKETGQTRNIITDIGDQMYYERGAGIVTTPVPTGMKLGTGSTATAKFGAGAALVTYLSNSHQAFDATYPQSALVGHTRQLTYKVTYAAGKATSAATAITEVVIVNETLADSTSAATATVSRALLSPAVASKQSTDSLTLTWTHTGAGS